MLDATGRITCVGDTDAVGSYLSQLAHCNAIRLNPLLAQHEGLATHTYL